MRLFDYSGRLRVYKVCSCYKGVMTEPENHWFNPYVCKNPFEWKAWSSRPARWSWCITSEFLCTHSLTHTCGLILKGMNNGCWLGFQRDSEGERMLNEMKTDVWLWQGATKAWPLVLDESTHTNPLPICGQTCHAVRNVPVSGGMSPGGGVVGSGRLPAARKRCPAPCLMTLSVAGTFLEIYCNWERRKEPFSYWQKTLHHSKFHLLRRVTYIYHGYLLRTRSWVIGSVGQVAVGMIHINVLPQMIVHLLPLFSGGEATVRQCHSLRHRPRVTIITSQFKKSFYRSMLALDLNLKFFTFNLVTV